MLYYGMDYHRYRRRSCFGYPHCKHQYRPAGTRLCCGTAWNLSLDMEYRLPLESPVRRENRQENLPHGAGGGLPTAGRYHKG